MKQVRVKFVCNVSRNGPRSSTLSFFANWKVIVKNINRVLQTEIMLKILFATRLPFISTGILSYNVLFAAIDMASCIMRSVYSLNRNDTD